MKAYTDINQSKTCISGGDAGVTLTRDQRYKENLEVKEVDLEKEIELVKGDYEQVDVAWNNDFDFIAKHFYELGLKAKGEIYVVTRSEEHADYVEAAFLSESKAKEYCKPFNENENSYGRNITKIKIQ